MVDGASVPVAVVSSRTEADLIVGLLNTHGVSAVVVADDVGGQEPQLQLEGVHLLVAPGDADVARRLLAEQGTVGDEGPGTRPATVPGVSP